MKKIRYKKISPGRGAYLRCFTVVFACQSEPTKEDRKSPLFRNSYSSMRRLRLVNPPLRTVETTNQTLFYEKSASSKRGKDLLRASIAGGVAANNQRFRLYCHTGDKIETQRCSVGRSCFCTSFPFELKHISVLQKVFCISLKGFVCLLGSFWGGVCGG